MVDPPCACRCVDICRVSAGSVVCYEAASGGVDAVDAVVAGGVSDDACAIAGVHASCVSCGRVVYQACAVAAVDAIRCVLA